MLLERIKKRRKDLGLTQEALGEKIGTISKTIWRIENGERKVKTDTLLKIASALNTTTAYLLGEIEDPSPMPIQRAEEDNIPQPIRPLQILLPVLDQEACAGNGFDFDDIEAHAIDWMPWPVSEMGGSSSPRSPYFIRVDGDSMSGVDIDDGDWVLVNPNVEVLSGNPAYVKWNGRCSIKGVIFYPDGRVELRPANPNYQPLWIADVEDENFKILGKVVRWTISGVPKDVI
jgi:phage repressor protein C with HTH and peptisase S24 domain